MFIKRQIQYLLQPLGNEAWEITYVIRENVTSVAFGEERRGGSRQEADWVEARRPPYGTPAPSSWEYTGFDEFEMPHPNWDEHIASRGWIMIPGVWYQYCWTKWSVYKRMDVWRGSDDGDILSQLYAFGAKYEGPCLRFPEKGADYLISTGEAVGAVLDLKWRLSEQAGHDIGTYFAVKQWIASL